MTDAVVGFQAPEIDECQLVMLLSDGEEVTPVDPMPGEILSFRYDLRKNFQEGPPLTRWYRNGLEIPHFRDRLNYKLTQEDVGYQVKLQLIPTSPDGKHGRAAYSSSGISIPPVPKVHSIGMEGLFRTGEVLTAKLKGRRLDLLDPPVFEWAASTGSQITRLAIGPSITIQPHDVGLRFILKLTPSYQGSHLDTLETRSIKIEPTPALKADPFVGLPCEVVNLPKGASVRWLSRKDPDSHQWEYLCAGGQYTPVKADLGSILQVECTWVDGTGSDASEIIETKAVGYPPPIVHSQPRIYGEGVEGGTLKCQGCEESCPAEGQLVVKWQWAEDTEVSPEWETIFEGPTMQLVASDVGGKIRVSVAASLRGRVGPSVSTEYPSIIQPSETADIVVQKCAFSMFPVLTSVTPVSWEISDDGCHTWQPSDVRFFATTADTAYRTVRGMDAEGREVGRMLIGIPAQVSSLVESYLLDGVAGFGVKIDGKFSQLILSSGGFKLHTGDARSSTLSQKVKWAKGITISCLDDPFACAITTPGAPPSILSCLKQSERDLAVVAFRMFLSLSAPTQWYVSQLPPGLPSAWRKGHTHGKKLRKSDRELLVNFLGSKQPQRHGPTLDTTKNTFLAFMSKGKKAHE
eukprot:TRINITY_DN12705_c0_g1_i2.p1 TRINITY_DN12705_c0_g1~~TRINITY_DN12705_c0_g1_i2.p1  ORF type:complete len:633 (+),score=107.70 TRINITY_DN12705_c0_g1_i2:281-2179(+)